MKPSAHQRAERGLAELTSLPTATGHEDRVVAWVERWAKRRRSVTIKRDRYGNLMLKRVGVSSRRPIVFTAHLDHPAFVVTACDGDRVTAEFRGGVRDKYFVGTAVRLHRDGIDRPGPRGVVETLRPAEGRSFKTVGVRFVSAVDAQPGDILTWDLGAAKIKGDRLHAPACDDLAAAAAMFAAFGELLKLRRTSKRDVPDVRLLCTRAEEVGFIGAIGACKSGLIPKGARLIALENSKSFAESPIGGGPIVRVGDRTSTFDPALTYQVGQVAQALAGRDADFRWQRKLMTGGTCEASAFQALGYTATCVCLPLGNYHNMNEDHGRIEPEVIALSDYHGLVRLLVEVGKSLDDPATTVPFKAVLDRLFDDRRSLLAPKK
ncbi:MAG: M20/M25/M40 family metallo-hydrolase [Planctomycetota bacterium]